LIRFKWENEFRETEIGRIPRDWKIEPIREMANFANGLSYASSEKLDEPSGYVFITLNNVIEGGGFKKEYSWIQSERIGKRHFVREGDLIIANVHFGVGGSGYGRLLGTPAIVVFPKNYDKSEGVYSLDVTKVLLKDPDYKSFLYWFLAMTQQETASFHTGTTVWHLDISNFKKNKLVILPTRHEMHYVPTVLSWFDSLIENKERQNEILENTAMAIFKNWFGNMEPVEAEELGSRKEQEIPQGWGVTSLFDIADWVNGHAFDQKTLNIEKKGLPVIKIAELKNGITDSTQYYDGQIDPVYRLRQGDLLFAWSASIGVYAWSAGDALLNQHIFRVFPKIDTSLLYFLLKKIRFLFQRIVENKATTMGHVTIKDLKRINIYVPDEDKQPSISRVLDPLFQKIVVNQKEIIVLKRVRDSLSPLLVFGKLRIEEI
jgi:type I restriction enzyme S subunit